MASKQVDAMTAGRRKKAAARREAEIKAVREYRAWCKRDAKFYRALLDARDRHGFDSKEAKSASRTWREHTKTMPIIEGIAKEAWEEVWGAGWEDV